MSNTMLPKIVINLIRMVRKNACGIYLFIRVGLNPNDKWNMNFELLKNINRFQSWKNWTSNPSEPTRFISSAKIKLQIRYTWALKNLNPWTVGFIQHYYLFYHDMISPPLYGRKIEYSVFSEFTQLGKFLCHLQ